MLPANTALNIFWLCMRWVSCSREIGLCIRIAFQHEILQLLLTCRFTIFFRQFEMESLTCAADLIVTKELFMTGAIRFIFFLINPIFFIKIIVTIVLMVFFFLPLSFCLFSLVLSCWWNAFLSVCLSVCLYFLFESWLCTIFHKKFAFTLEFITQTKRKGWQKKPLAI